MSDDLKKAICPLCGSVVRTYQLKDEAGQYYLVRHDNERGVTCQGSHTPVMK